MPKSKSSQAIGSAVSKGQSKSHRASKTPKPTKAIHKRRSIVSVVKGHNIYEFSQGKPGSPGVRSTPFRLLLETEKVDGIEITIPKKLGDGNFGMVFEAPDPNAANTSYALKILYDHRAGASGDLQKNEAELKRVQAELHVGINIPEEIDKYLTQFQAADSTFPATAPLQLARLVAPIAYCEDFDEFEGKEALSDQDIVFSKYAYLMKKCDESLKDQVERSDDPSDKAIGYGRLRSAEKLERVKSALPIAKQIAQGLQVLHAAGLRHQDIKPANIYYSADADGNIDYRLGDMGFLLPHDPKLAGTAAASLDAIGIGTKHYRSIEQVDFNDTAECKISVDPDHSDRATLETYDPKFSDTIIRRGDLAVLAKSATHRLLVVNAVKHDEKSTKTTVRVTLVRESRIDGNGLSEGRFLTDDEKTQVSFFKNPSAKTDLFGLSGIIYDIITGGDSPERFYELLRRFDTRETSADQILESYSIWRNGFLDDPDLAAIFSRINGGTDRTEVLDERILRFVLRTMMSDADDSYFRTFEFDDQLPGEEIEPNDDAIVEVRVKAVAGWRQVIAALDRMLQDFAALNYTNPQVNLLTKPAEKRPDPEFDAPPASSQKALSQVIPSYRAGVPPDVGDALKKDIDSKVNTKITYRWIISGALIRSLVTSIRNLGETRSMFLASLSPEHLTVDESTLKLGPNVYDMAKPLHKQLRSRDPMLTRIRPYASRFEPIWWQHASRRIRVSKFEILKPSTDRQTVEPTAENDPKTNLRNQSTGRDAFGEKIPPIGVCIEAKYDLVDWSLATPEFGVGDYVIPNQGVHEIYEVLAHEVGRKLTLKPIITESDEASNGVKTEVKAAEKFEQAHLLKQPNPVNYYGGMIATYLYQLLIADGVGQSRQIDDFPDSVLSNLKAYPIAFRASPSAEATAHAEHTTEAFQRYTIQFIVWLILGGFSWNSKNELMNDDDKWQMIYDETIEWLRYLENILDCNGQIAGTHLLNKSGYDLADQVSEKMGNVFQSIKVDDWQSVSQDYLINQNGAESERSETTWLSIGGKVIDQLRRRS